MMIAVMLSSGLSMAYTTKDQPIVESSNNNIGLDERYIYTITAIPCAMSSLCYLLVRPTLGLLKHNVTTHDDDLRR